MNTTMLASALDFLDNNNKETMLNEIVLFQILSVSLGIVCSLNVMVKL